MKAHKTEITIKTRDGDKKVSCLAFKHWAFHKTYEYAEVWEIAENWKNDDYTITHIASGKAFPFHYLPLQKKARILAEMLESMFVQWDGKGEPSKKFEAGCLKVKNKFVSDIA